MMGLNGISALLQTSTTVENLNCESRTNLQLMNKLMKDRCTLEMIHTHN